MFLSDLEQLLSTVQSGDATASKIAGNSLIHDVKSMGAVQNATYAYFLVVGWASGMRG
jgi:hypothetical protein